MFDSNRYQSAMSPHPCFNKKCFYRDDSTLSTTNRDSFNNKYSLKSNRTISHYSNFGNYKQENNNYDLISKIQSNNKENINNFLYQNNYLYHYCFNNNYYYLNNEKNDSIKNKTINILNLNGKSKSNIEEISSSKNISIYKNHFDNYKSFTNKKNKKLIVKNIHQNNNNSDSERNNNKYLRDNKIIFDLEKSNLELIRQKYINNTINTQKNIHEIKKGLNKYDININNILELESKCLKYSDLIKPDNLYKYREENNNNLKKYMQKLKNKNIIKRPLSYNKNSQKKKPNKNNIKNKNNLNKKQKCISAENIKGKKKEPRKKIINKGVSKVLKTNNITNNIQKKLDYYNYLLKDNKEKKILLFEELDHKSRENYYFKNNHFINYDYGYNFSKGYNYQNFDKNLHLKYIYHPENQLNQNVYIQMKEENKDKDNYHIESFNYKRKNFKF